MISPNQPVERMAAGAAVLIIRERWAAPSLIFSVRPRYCPAQIRDHETTNKLSKSRACFVSVSYDVSDSVAPWVGAIRAVGSANVPDILLGF
jgi:hypothetical protein